MTAAALPLTTLEALADQLEDAPRVDTARAWAQDLIEAGWDAPVVVDLAAVEDHEGLEAAALRAEALAAVGIDPTREETVAAAIRNMLFQAIVDERLDSREAVRLGCRYYAGVLPPGLAAFSDLADRVDLIEEGAVRDPDYARLGHRAWTIERLTAAAAGEAVAAAEAPPRPLWLRIYGGFLIVAVVGFFAWKLLETLLG